MRQSHARKYLFFLLIFLLAHTWIYAQNNFTYKAVLSPVLQSGFYNISLSPGIIAKCKTDLGDIRIKDNAGNEAAYILYTETARLNEDAFTEFPVSYSDNRASVIIDNILPNSINRLFLLIKNSDAQRVATLSGSDDEKHWYVIKENIVLQNEYPADSDAFAQSVSFPQSSYKYFRVTMQGKNILPLNIVKAGVYRQSFAGSTYDTLPAPGIVQTDSADRKTYVYLSLGSEYQIDKLSLAASGIKYYRRHLMVYDKNTINSPLADDTISSGKAADIELRAKTSRLLVVIDNYDNAPLKVTGATMFQLHTSATAYLEAGAKYTLFFGDSSAVLPVYDLQYFNDSIGSNIHSLAVKNIEKISAVATVKEKKNTAAMVLLWGAIIVVLLLLIYFSFKMMKEMKNHGNAD